jgi:hypothetical protein
MIILHNFGIGLMEYEARGKENDFPTLVTCPNCKCMAQGNLHRNGYYWRFGVTDVEVVKIPICRLRCLECEKNFSIIPDFLIPYFQHTVHTILERVHQILQKKKANGSRQLMTYHLKRYLKSLHWVHSFFTDVGNVLGFSEDIKKEAIKYMKMILDFGESPFLRRSWGHLSSHFMAH